jgi:hypothetical protein
VSFQAAFWLIVLLHWGLALAIATGYFDPYDFVEIG